MSYILDALNKSEQERQGQQTPGLQTVHRPPPGKTTSRFPLLVVVGLFAAINIAGIGYWLTSQNNSAADSTSANTGTPEQPAQQSVQSAPQSAPLTNQMPERTEIVASQEQTAVSRSPAPESRQDPAPQTIQTVDQGTLITPETAFVSETNTISNTVRITELPVNVQRQIPDLVFSSHLYSDEASFRMVNINGKMRREGDMIANNLKLIEVSEEGVILGFRHYVFEVSVLRDWSFN